MACSLAKRNPPRARETTAGYGAKTRLTLLGNQVTLLLRQTARLNSSNFAAGGLEKALGFIDEALVG
jgi:hypothetical protein